ncbi:MAG: hypothetical protein P8099_09910 [Gemmatimonadota bacterium]
MKERVMIRALVIAVAAFGLARSGVSAQAPAGLAREALRRSDFHWINRAAPGVRVHFLAGSYPALHQDSLIRRVLAARDTDLALLDGPAYDRTLDVFFVESRPQLQSLIGQRATGFAQLDSAAVFLVTNPDWRAFERHEIMHILATSAWGRPAPPGAWIQEGLAQFADGACGGFTNDAVAAGLMRRDGVIPLDTLVTRFRTLNDLAAYLDAASVVGYVYHTYGLAAVRRLWQEGSGTAVSALGRSLGDLEKEWRASLPDGSALPPVERIAAIRKHGCG